MDEHEVASSIRLVCHHVGAVYNEMSVATIHGDGLAATETECGVTIKREIERLAKDGLRETGDRRMQRFLFCALAAKPNTTQSDEVVNHSSDEMCLFGGLIESFHVRHTLHQLGLAWRCWR